MSLRLPVECQSLRLESEGNAHGEGFVNGCLVRFLVRPPLSELSHPRVEIPGLDPRQLALVGIELDFSQIYEDYQQQVMEDGRDRYLREQQRRKEYYVTSRLLKLGELLGDNYHVMSLQEFLDSKSGILLGLYTVQYRNHHKELSVFEHDDHFTIYDPMTSHTVAGEVDTPLDVQEAIDNYLNDWKHKVDFKLTLIEHAEDDSKPITDPMHPLRATDYFKRVLQKESAHEDDIARNHELYLKELGTLGDSEEITSFKDLYQDSESTRSMDRRHIIGSLTDTQIMRFKPPISPDQLGKKEDKK